MNLSYDPDNWDVFISHATEDKEDIARPLAYSLMKAGLKVWFDDFTLKIGDSLSGSIDYGLAHSKYGIVIISEHFLSKKWPQKELAGLFAKEDNTNKKVILPIWHNITEEQIKKKAPILVDKVAAVSSVGVPELTKQLLQVMNLSFKGEDISGIWYGKSGRLRLFLINDRIEGDYDWNGYDWTGHVIGGYENNIFRFNWHWDRSPEKGNGFFEYIPNENMLIGGWAFDYQQVDVYLLSPDKLKYLVHEWFFHKQI
jgi:hypothetical protein